MTESFLKMTENDRDRKWPLSKDQKTIPKAAFAIRCKNRKHLYIYTSVTYELFFNILREKACFQIAECSKYGGKDIIKSWLVGLSACYLYVKISPPSKKFSFVYHVLSAFKSSLNHNSPESRFLPILWSSLMTGACHLLRPASVVIDDRLLAQEDCSFDCRCKGTKNHPRMQ